MSTVTTEGGVLRTALLFVSGASALAAARNQPTPTRLCDRYWAARYHLSVVDIHDGPDELLSDLQPLGHTDTVKSLPEPVRRVVGDLSQTDKVLQTLDLPASRTPRAIDEKRMTRSSTDCRSTTPSCRSTPNRARSDTKLVEFAERPAHQRTCQRRSRRRWSDVRGRGHAASHCRGRGRRLCRSRTVERNDACSRCRRPTGRTGSSSRTCVTAR